MATARGDGPGAMGDVERMMRGGHEWPGAGANKPLNGGRAWRWACYALSVFGSLLSRVGCAPRRENLCHGLSGDDSKPVQASKGGVSLELLSWGGGYQGQLGVSLALW